MLCVISTVQLTFNEGKHGIISLREKTPFDVLKEQNNEKQLQQGNNVHREATSESAIKN